MYARVHFVRLRQAACAAAHKAVDSVDWPEGFCRRDIGYRAVARIAGK